MSEPMINLGPDRAPVDNRPSVLDIRELVLVFAVCALLLLGMAILLEVRAVRADLEQKAAKDAKELAAFDRHAPSNGGGR